MTVKETIIVWLKAARAPFLIVSFLPCIVGGLAAYAYGSFDWITFTLLTIGIVMAHSAADFIDDYFDFINGNLGNKDQQFHDSPLIHGQITTKQVLIATILCTVIALICGIYLLGTIGMPVVYMTLAGLFIVFFYTSPPVRLNYRGLGETALFFAFGPLLIFGVYLVLTNNYSLEPLLISIPIGIFTMNIGLVSNIFDYDDDVKSGKKCIPVRFGQKNAHALLKTTYILAYLVLIISVLLGLLNAWLLVMLFTAPLAYLAIKETAGFNDLSNYESAMGRAIALSSLGSVSLIIGYVLQLLLG